MLTVHEKYYEQKLDRNLERLLPDDLRIEKVKAFGITKPRIIGDVGLRAFFQLYKRAKSIIKSEHIDFLLITIPSFYCALLGRWLHKATKIPYGIDYQDPWVHQFPGSDRILSRSWLATVISKYLEPIAVKNVNLITGVSEGYYKDVLDRNPHLSDQCLFSDLPIGTEISDHEKVKTLNIKPYLFTREPGKIKLVYAGTMLPKSYGPFEMVCKSISENIEKYEGIEIYFIGSGSKTDNPESYNVKPIAEKFGLWEKVIFEYPARIPYLDVLVHLEESDGIFILGSTEIHYSPSKVYQGIASGKPVFAILHYKSSAVDVINKSYAGITLTFDGENDLDKIYNTFDTTFSRYLNFIRTFDKAQVHYNNIKDFFAENITGKLVGLLNKIVPDKPELKKILIISPHFPPSNLTAVHRARLFSQYLPEFGWEPIILTVDEKYYEERPDYDLLKLVNKDLRIEKVSAMKVFIPRIIGDIGLRAFISMYRKAKRIIRDENIDFLYIIIPSFYGALWGRMLYNKTGIRYGIDYIDPWVHVFPGGDKAFSRAWFATKFSKILEPIAVKKASLISGVAESYYSDVFQRNKSLHKSCNAVTLPPAAEENDYVQIKEMKFKNKLFVKKGGKIQLVYAGAMLPKAYAPLEQIFITLANNRDKFRDVQFHFIGTGKSTTDPNGFNIRPLAERYGLWKSNVYEYPMRIPYLDVLVHLNEADGVFILGSTEPHYTPSKVYQAVLSRKPILAILHHASTGVEVIRKSHAGIVLDFDGEQDLEKIKSTFATVFDEYRNFVTKYDFTEVDHSPFREYSAERITGVLVSSINKVIKSE